MTGYCVTVDVLLDGHSPLDPAILGDTTVDRLGAMTDALAHLYGAISGDERGWSATVTLDDDTLNGARDRAVSEILAAADRARLPTAPVVRVEVVREDVRDAEQERPTLLDLVSGPEAAEILGVSRQRVHQLAHEHPDFPAPAYQLGVGSLWFRAGVEAFGQRWERRAGRPPSKTA
ncbi:helix-turn-helix transcriptional regulator [Jiangella alkaliphila]|uniref:Helix-turn-helix domain-containing protein n=1 Tax=Jiangella alkaliphila TaxID=419479 RepID=A0A1H2L8L2_9ACTN|nr:hypothetical protein [Jiangella alkaliphila]SDU77045.1 hypothetical protein SAMN04488563_5402 [Jiangella alkaliphila]